MDWRCLENSRLRSTIAKARSSRCRADPEATAGRTVSADLDSVRAREGSATALDSSLQAGADSRAGEDRATAPGHESGRDEEAEAVEQSWCVCDAPATTETVGQPAARRPVQGKRDVEWADRSARPSRGGSGREEREGPTADDTAGRWAHYFPGLRTDHGRCEPISAREAAGEVVGCDSGVGKEYLTRCEKEE